MGAYYVCLMIVLTRTINLYTTNEIRRALATLCCICANLPPKRSLPTLTPRPDSPASTCQNKNSSMIRNKIQCHFPLSTASYYKQKPCAPSTTRQYGHTSATVLIASILLFGPLIHLFKLPVMISSARRLFLLDPLLIPILSHNPLLSVLTRLLIASIYSVLRIVLLMLMVCRPLIWR